MQKTIFEVKPGSFVFEQSRALPRDVCAEMIARFEKYRDEQYPGRIGQTMGYDDSIKRSTDLAISGKPHWRDLDRELFRSLNRALSEFKQYYPFFAGPFKDNGYAIQRTDAGEFYRWHIDGGSHEFAMRQLVAIWYLNSLENQGGETEFRYQDIQITPEAGKLVLFPPFWTHLHRGKTLQSGNKHIATTWVVFA
ncbi:MAG: 2OG-Fe(II) oxygenase [Gammaproteobacteria bacterium]|nr:2OG-Fe(II) oxygenase [Gammaproteobacteria bacterium]MDH3536372.1 2OG-Fe(II) oxygenase [Gammaproteobacteria bacterium]